MTKRQRNIRRRKKIKVLIYWPNKRARNLAFRAMGNRS